MALRFVDGCDHYTDMNLKWQNIGATWGGPGSGGSATIVSGLGRFGTNAIKASGTNSGVYWQRNIDSQTGWIVGFAYNISSMSSHTLCSIYNRSLGYQGELRLTSSGNLQLTRNGTQVALSSQLIQINQFNYIELKLLIDPTAGTLEVRVNGQVWATFSGNTEGVASSTADTIIFGAPNGGTTTTEYWDDFYICDSTGTANNNYLGDIRIQTLYPNGAGADNTFTQTGGTGGQPATAVSEASPDGDTSYVSSSTVGNSQTFTMQDITTASALVKGVQVGAISRKDDAGTRTFAHVARPSITDTVGADQYLGTTYGYYSTIWEKNPDTNNPWQPTEINGAEFGVKVTS